MMPFLLEFDLLSLLRYFPWSDAKYHRRRLDTVWSFLGPTGASHESPTRFSTFLPTDQFSEWVIIFLNVILRVSAPAMLIRTSIVDSWTLQISGLPNAAWSTEEKIPVLIPGLPNLCVCVPVNGLLSWPYFSLWFSIYGGMQMLLLMVQLLSADFIQIV